MGSVTAAQLVFSHADVNTSPARQQGFQTLFHTHGAFDPAEKSAIEARLFYCPPLELPAKHVFFLTHTGKAVVARIGPLEDTDRLGRKGLYIAHALALTEKDFAVGGWNPFQVLDRFRFVTTLDEAFQIGDPRTGSISPVEVELDRTRGDSEPASLVWSLGVEEIVSLLHLAGRSSYLVAGRRAVGFLGRPEQMYSLLRGLFELIPPELRSQCSFDTVFAGGTLHRSPYWAIGLPAGAGRQPNVVKFDLAEGRLATAIDFLPSGPFERWLKETLTRTPLRHVASETAHAYWLGQLLESGSRELSSLSGLDPGFVGAFMELNRSSLDARVREVLAAQVGRALGDLVCGVASAWVREHGEEGVRSLQAGFALESLTDWIYTAVTGLTQPPSEQGLVGLRCLLQKVAHPRLSLAYLRWAEVWEELESALRHAEKETFEWFVDWVLSAPPVRMEWELRPTPPGPLLVCQVAQERRDSLQSRHLLLALLRSTFREQAPGEGPHEASVRPSEAPRRSASRHLEKRGQTEPSQELVPMARLDKERWLWLLTSLSKASETQ